MRRPTGKGRSKTAKKIVRRFTGGTGTTRRSSVRKYTATRRKHNATAERRTWKRGVVFVGMAFGKRQSNAIYHAIEQACDALDLRCETSDRQVGSPPVVDTIKKLIEDAEYLVFDLSYERPNVYYELGYAHGVGNRGKDILLVAGGRSKIHFDTAGLNVRFYKTSAQLRTILEAELKAMMKAFRRGRPRRSPVN